MKWWHWALIAGGGLMVVKSMQQKDGGVITGGVITPDTEACKRAVGCFLQRHSLKAYADGDAAAQAFTSAKAVCKKAGVDPVAMENSLPESTYMLMQGC